MLGGGDYMVFRGNRDKSSLTEYKKGTVEKLTASEGDVTDVGI